MGLDFRCEGERVQGASWSYSGFGHFRKSLASLIGIELDQMIGFGGEQEWSSLPPDAIHEFLDHSDCDGELTAEQCARIAPRLSELVKQLTDEYDKACGLRLAERMRQCGEAGTVLEFC